MATTAGQVGLASANRLNVISVSLTAALAATAFIVLCWIGAVIGLGPVSHMALQMFSPADVTSAVALIVGICWSFVGGLVAGGLFAMIYNLFEWLER